MLYGANRCVLLPEPCKGSCQKKDTCSCHKNDLTGAVFCKCADCNNIANFHMNVNNKDGDI